MKYYIAVAGKTCMIGVFFTALFVGPLLAAEQGARNQNMRISGYSDEKNVNHKCVHPDSLPLSMESYTIRRNTEQGDVTLKMKNGDITYLEIDGKVIDREEYPEHQTLINKLKPGSGQKKNGIWFSYGYPGSTDSWNMAFPDLDSLFQQLDSEDNGFSLRFEDMDKWDSSFFLDSLLRQFPFHRLWGENHSPSDRESFELNSPFRTDTPDNDESVDDIGNPTGFSAVIGSALNRDGLLIPGKENTIELTYKYLKINGDKQPENIFQKYKRLFEESSGTALQKKSKIYFSWTGKESKRKYRVY